MPSTLEKINVRKLTDYLQNAMQPILEDHMFQINDIHTRQSIIHSTQYLLENCKNTQSLYDYKVICDSSNNSMYDQTTGNLNVDIMLQPDPSAAICRMSVRLNNGIPTFEHPFCEDY